MIKILFNYYIIYFNNPKIIFDYLLKDFILGIGDWGLGIGDWGLGIGPNPQSPIPNPHPQSPIPNPHISIAII
jgi:hypothetical protein